MQKGKQLWFRPEPQLTFKRKKKYVYNIIFLEMSVCVGLFRIELLFIHLERYVGGRKLLKCTDR